MIASAALARGRLHLAEDDSVAARWECETSVTLRNGVGTPYETALARTGLG